MSGKEGLKIKRKILLFVNVFLIIVIAFVVYQKYLKKSEEIQFDCRYNSKSPSLVGLIDKHFHGAEKKKLQYIVFFNSAPEPSEIEIIEKVYKKYKKNINVFVLFREKPDKSLMMNFPYSVSGAHIKCSKDGLVFDKNFYMVLNEDHVSFSHHSFNLSDIVFIIHKKIHPDLNYKDYAFTGEELRQKIIDRLKKGNIRLFNLNDEKIEQITNPTDYSNVYFIHSGCSSCELKSLFSKIRLKELLDEEDNIIIFSGLASTVKLGRLIKERDIDLRIYVDIEDEFQLLAVITNEKSNPLTIRVDDFIDDREDG